MSDIAINPSTHADIRGAARSYKRDKNHATKWTFGARTDMKKPVLDSAWTANTSNTTVSVKVIPEKWNGRLSNQAKFHNHNHNANVSTKARGLSHHTIESANLRVTRKQDALREITSPDAKELSRSLADLLPSSTTTTTTTSFIPINRHQAPDADILYSFDRKASPSDRVGLQSLIERAEQKWREKETVRLVRCEYEVLDGDGEREVVRKVGKVKGGGGGRSLVGLKGVVVSAAGGLDDDEDYELV